MGSTSFDRTGGPRLTKAGRTLEVEKLRAKAPLAAQFEDCAEAVKQLHAALDAHPSASEHEPSALDHLRILVDKCQRRLISWGHDTGASSRLLDHSLRRASKPRSSTLALLKELHDRLVKAIEALPTSFDGFGERPKEDYPSKQEQKKDLFEILGLDDEEAEGGQDDPNSSPENYLTEAEEILEDLSHLRSVLLDPYDDEHQDPVPYAVMQKGEREDRDYAMIAFSNAPTFLIDRLEEANRRRREHIYTLRKQEETRLGQLGELRDGRLPGSAIAPTTMIKSGSVRAFSKRPRIKASGSRMGGYRKTKTPSGSEAGASRTAPSTITAKTSLFSRDIVARKQESVTSMTPSSTRAVAVPELRPPAPPVSLTTLYTNPPRNPSLPFRCQFCTFDVPLELEKFTMTREDWVAHFFLDLQPYTCTFQKCSRAQKLFGIKQQWWQHELDCHREHRKQVWYCANPKCKKEFETRDLFEHHLRTEHSSLYDLHPPEVIDAFIDNCQRLSLESPSYADQECCFCGFVDQEKPTEGNLMDHIAHHLEQFALLALGEDEDPASSDDEVDANERVTEFLDGMTLNKKLQIEQTTQSIVITIPEEQNATTIHPSIVPEESNLHDLSNSSGLGESNGLDTRRRPTSGSLWQSKVKTYLSKEAENENNITDTLATEISSRLKEELIRQGEDPLPLGGAIAESHLRNAAEERLEESIKETVWHKVPKRNEEFVGREDDLYRLKNFIAQPGHICVISGRGGIGKTATAVEYARRFGHVYSHIVWIEAETPGSLDDQYGSIGTHIFSLGRESEQDPVSFSITVRGKLGAWEKKWLLIFDNVEAWKDISRYIPRNLARGQGSILITTRLQSLIEVDKPALEQVLHRIKLEPLTSQEAGQFLLCSIDPRVTPSEAPKHRDHDLAVQIAEHVDRLPLALIMVSGYVKVSRATLEDFLEIWEEKTKFRAKQAMRADGTQRRRWVTEGRLDNSIDLLWDIGISELPNPARDLLEILAFLDPENIQKSLLVRDHDEHYLEFLNSTETALYQRMIRHLGGRKLIEIREREDDGVKTESYRIHRLLQEKIVAEVGAQLKFDSAMRKATRLVRKVFPKAPAIQAPAPQNWKACKDYMPHIYSLLRAFKAAVDQFPSFERTEELAELFYDAGFYIWDRGQSEADGLEFLKTAEDILDKLNIDPSSERRADIHCMSGLLYNTMGCQQRNKSFQRLQLALDIRKNIFDSQAHYDRDKDVLLQNAATDYAILLLNRYEFEEAEEIFTKCLARYRIWGSEDEIPFEYSKYYYNMGVVRMCQNRIAEAIQLLQRSVELAEAKYGKQSQYWDNYFMLACCVRVAGDGERALEMQLEILKANIDQIGKHSKKSILSTFAVGVIYGNLGDIPKAIEYLEECVELANTSNTWTEESIGRALACLASLYREHGINPKKASELQATADEIRNNYAKYASDWVVCTGDQFTIFDDLQPTDEGRYTGSLLLQTLWARQRGEKIGHFIDSWGKAVTFPTGL